MFSASSAYSPSPWEPSAARTRQRATGTDSGMPGKGNVISRGSACAAVLAITWGPFVPALGQPARPGPEAGSHCVADGKRPAGLAILASHATGPPGCPEVPRFAG